MNIRAVVVFVSASPPSDSLNWGATNTTAPSKTYIDICDVTIILKVSAWLLILMLAAVRDTSTASSNRSALRRAVEPDLLEAVEKISEPVVEPPLPFGCPLFFRDQLAVFRVKDDCRYRDDNQGREDRRQRQKTDVDRDKEDQNRALHSEASMLLAWVSTAVSPVIAATMLERPIPSIERSSERLIWSIRRTRIL